MKISEITDKNVTWNALNDLDINKITEEYRFIKQSFDLAKRLKRSQLMPTIQNMIVDLVSDIDKFVNSKHPDPTDPDIISNKKLLEMYKENLYKMYNDLG